MRIGSATTSSYPLRAGNSVRPLVDGIPAFRAILEAVEAATASVWVTVAFLDEDLVFPDGRGSFFDVLERAAARGVDVRVLFWSEPQIEELVAGSAHFPAVLASSEILAERAPHVLARWDRLKGYCHHQKSWLIDAGTAREVAFVGGINLDRDSIVTPGHPPGEAMHGPSIHDVYARLRGPSVTDVHHNFVQRWNEASEREMPFGAFPSLTLADDLEFPVSVSPEAGSARVQIGRTVRSDVYRRGVASPGAEPFPILNGETSILEQYLLAIDAARRTIYLENQMLLCPYLIPRIDAALQRGVDVVAVLPGQAMPEIARARRNPNASIVFQMLDDLGRHDNFLMAALGGTGAEGQPTDIYVHAKIAMIDDEWLTIGSANAMFRSFRDDTELNLTAWEPAVAAELRRELMAEHLGDVSAVASGPLADDRAAVALLRERAAANRECRREGHPMQGNIFAIAPTEWAVDGV